MSTSEEIWIDLNTCFRWRISSKNALACFQSNRTVSVAEKNHWKLACWLRPPPLTGFFFFCPPRSRARRCHHFGFCFSPTSAAFPFSAFSNLTQRAFTAICFAVIHGGTSSWRNMSADKTRNSIKDWKFTVWINTHGMYEYSNSLVDPCSMRDRNSETELFFERAFSLKHNWYKT